VRDVPMPRDLSEEAVAEWLYVNSDPFNESRVPWGGLYDGERNKWRFLARAVRALVEATGEKVARQAYHAGYSACVAGIDVTTRIDADVYFILARVIGEEAPRG